MSDEPADKTMWESRIVGYETINPEQVLANPQNFRTHPESQAAPLRALLSNVGIVQNIIINRTTGHLIDGHLRVMEALKAGQSELPATIVELSPDEERLILASYDHLSSLAGIDVAQLDALLRDVSSDNADIQAMISEFADTHGVLDALIENNETEQVLEDDRSKQFGELFYVVITCTTEDMQKELFAEMGERGLQCRLVLS